VEPEFVLRAGVELTASGEWLEFLPAALGLAAAGSAASALKAKVDGPAGFELEPGAMRGRTVVVTGASSGLGFETAVRLARAGAVVVATARTEAKAAATQAALRTAAASAAVHCLVLDLADLASVRAFVDELRRQPYGRRLDVLVNNAGVMAVPEFQTTKDGFEMQLGVNHLGHFALTGLLIPLLLRAEGYARVISVSSLAHRLGDEGEIWKGFSVSPRSRGAYSAWPAYNLSKLANVIFARELDRRFREAGVEATAVSLHPGICPTGLARYAVAGADKPMDDIYADWPLPVQAVMQALKGTLRPVDRGANSHMYLAAGADGGYMCSGGLYFEDMRPADAHDAASDEALGRRLWEESERSTGVLFDFAAPAEAAAPAAGVGVASGG